jgi:carbon-monoxide dehydrogenase medium subunit
MAKGVCASAAIALTNVADTPLLATDAAEAVIDTPVDEAAIEEAVRGARAIANPSADGRGPVEFRRYVAGVMVRRALMRAKERAG